MESFLEGQRRRHQKWYYSNLEHARKRGRIHAKNWRDKNRERLRKENSDRWLKNSVRNRRFVNAYKIFWGCVDCGFIDSRALDLDHVRGKKKLRITNMVNWGWSILTIVKELEKCAVRCANCHRIRHHQEKPADEQEEP
jgi:hypothetical protein